MKPKFLQLYNKYATSYKYQQFPIKNKLQLCVLKTPGNLNKKYTATSCIKMIATTYIKMIATFIKIQYYNYLLVENKSKCNCIGLHNTKVKAVLTV
jgi:hypothetical protein